LNGRILIVDDEPRIASLLAKSLEREGLEATPVSSPTEALEILKSGGVDVLLTDLRMPGIDGLELLRRTRSISPATEVILMTAYASVETAREALTRGAVDYLVKPVSAEDELKPLLRRLLSDNDARQPGEESPRSHPPPPPKNLGDLPVTHSAQMKAIYDKIDKIARSNASVLLRGESGTGKEVLSDLIQSRSPRAGKPYLKINCGALPETLLESELFGHTRGSFTGAVSDRDGLFASSSGGTLLLDEIGEVSPALQVKLLRVLQIGEYNRVGDNAVRKADVRILAATNRDLEKMIEEGTFRQDLYYRLNVVPIVLPPLRDRPEDIPALIEHFARRFHPQGPVSFDDAVLSVLQSYEWPGNIRELENAIEHALVLGDPAAIVIEDLPVAIQNARMRTTGAAAASSVGRDTLESIEKRCLLSALEKTGGNRTHAARLLGITRRTLGYRLRKYELEEQAARLSAHNPAGKTT